jgi:hypothetical protein
MADGNPDEDDSEFEWRLDSDDEDSGYEWTTEDVQSYVNQLKDQFIERGSESNLYEVDTYEMSMSEEDEIAIELYKAGSAMRRFVQYLDTHDEFDPSSDELKTGMDHLNGGQRALMLAFASFGQDLQELSNRLEDDDDENPFRVN